MAKNADAVVNELVQSMSKCVELIDANLKSGDQHSVGALSSSLVSMTVAYKNLTTSSATPPGGK